jgi:hypothetical protein
MSGRAAQENKFLKQNADEMVKYDDEIPTFTVAILYGAYHISDLSERLLSMGFNIRPDINNNYISAWTVPIESRVYEANPRATLTVVSLPYDSSASHFISKPLQMMSPTKFPLIGMLFKSWKSPFLIFLGTALYLLYGAVDWMLLIAINIEVLESFITKTSLKIGELVLMDPGSTSVMSSSVNAIPWSGDSSMGVVLVFLFLYFTSYIQRHLTILQSLSTIGIQWDEGLFDDVS